MANLIGARQSPRVIAGEIKWYYGDTFSITFDLRLKDQDGEEVSLGNTIESSRDQITLELLDRSDRAVDLARHGNVTADVQGGTITMNVDDWLAAELARGQYTLFISVYHAGRRTTILHRCRVIIE